MKLLQVFLPLVIITSLEASQPNQQPVNNVGANFRTVFGRPNTPQPTRKVQKELKKLHEANQKAPARKK